MIDARIQGGQKMYQTELKSVLKAEYKTEIDWFLFELLKKQYSYICEDELKKIYLFEITDFEENALWAYGVNQALEKIESLSSNLYFELTEKGEFRWVKSWQKTTDDFKEGYIKSYRRHLEDVIYNCSVYWDERQHKVRGFVYPLSWLMDCGQEMYRRMTKDKKEQPAADKQRYKKGLVKAYE